METCQNCVNCTLKDEEMKRLRARIAELENENARLKEERGDEK